MPPWFQRFCVSAAYLLSVVGCSFSCGGDTACCLLCCVSLHTCVCCNHGACSRACVFVCTAGIVPSTERRDGANRHHLHQRERQQDQRPGSSEIFPFELDILYWSRKGNYFPCIWPAVGQSCLSCCVCLWMCCESEMQPNHSVCTGSRFCV